MVRSALRRRDSLWSLAVLAAALFALATDAAPFLSRPGRLVLQPLLSTHHHQSASTRLGRDSTVTPAAAATTVSTVLDLRGGASKRSKRRSSSSSSSSLRQKTATGRRKVGKAGSSSSSTKADDPSKASKLYQNYKKILPLTRLHITLVGVSTVLHVVLGDELCQAVLALDPLRVMYGLEFWRPFTAATYLGGPSISWLLSGYYLFQYGSSLERAYGISQYCLFMLSQIVLLSVLSILTGQPFYANSLITAMLHVLSRAMPYQKVKWLIFDVPYWSLPYGLMATDVLQQQSAMAALPHVLGILSGHFYQFHKFVWPKLAGGQDWLVPPETMVERLDPEQARSSSSSSEAGKRLSKAALAARRRKKGGRKLG